MKQIAIIIVIAVVPQTKTVSEWLFLLHTNTKCKALKLQHPMANGPFNDNNTQNKHTNLPSNGTKNQNVI